MRWNYETLVDENPRAALSNDGPAAIGPVAISMGTGDFGVRHILFAVVMIAEMALTTAIVTDPKTVISNVVSILLGVIGIALVHAMTEQ